ncbi:hypothetical protein ACRB68_40290 [Actinomadura sp. RB68]|uniref:histidine kinase n=2 Tax=Actinomadura macrotermitis TaxID=2585200 RepID=A0A7K0BXQ2_9ACTN|nr:hypothetical protein [Actinomadura macrotermitis]
MGRLWDWWRARRVLVDAAFVVPFLLLVALSASSETNPRNPTYVPWGWYVFFSVALLVPLVVRRRWPRSVFAAVALLCFAQWLLHIRMIPSDMAILVALYTVTAYCAFRWGLAALVVALAGVVMETTQQMGSWKHMRMPLLFFSTFIVGVWLLGLHMRTRRQYLRSLEERAERLERERDTEVQIARAGERARIARELHDVVAHNVSVIVVQADGASFAIDTDPARAKQALTTIGDTGRLALAEMRRLLGVLRAEDDSGAYAPQPGVEQLTELVEQIRAAGLPVTVRVAGVPLEVSQGRQLTIFRVVQEALTNTLKHAGPRASADVMLHYGDDAVDVVVMDDGRGAAAVVDGYGHGLIGMRERVAVYGGQVRAAPRAGGGFEVAARIPVREEARA